MPGLKSRPISEADLTAVCEEDPRSSSQGLKLAGPLSPYAGIEVPSYLRSFGPEMTVWTDPDSARV